MIPRIRRSLVQHGHRLSTQVHILSLECQIANSRHIFLTVTEVVREEEREGAGGVEQGAFDRNVLDVGGLGEGERLRGSGRADGVEVDVGGGQVEEDVQGLRGGWGRGGAEEEGVKTNLGCEAGCC